MMEWIVMELGRSFILHLSFCDIHKIFSPSEHIQEKCSPATGWQQGGLVS